MPRFSVDEEKDQTKYFRNSRGDTLCVTINAASRMAFYGVARQRAGDARIKLAGQKIARERAFFSMTLPETDPRASNEGDHHCTEDSTAVHRY